MTLSQTDIDRLLDAVEDRITKTFEKLKQGRLLAPKEAAAELGCSRSTIDRIVKSRKIKGTTVGKVRKYTLEELKK